MKPVYSKFKTYDENEYFYINIKQARTVMLFAALKFSDKRYLIYLLSIGRYKILSELKLEVIVNSVSINKFIMRK